VIKQRHCNSSLVCNLNDSEIFMMTREDFIRTFHVTESAWSKATGIANAKEFAYVNRCSHYLEVSKALLDQGKKETYEVPSPRNNPGQPSKHKKINSMDEDE
jgi:hypothetical protein